MSKKEENVNVEARKNLWKDVCNDYLKEFCDKHEFEYEPFMWVGDNPGTIVMIGDMFVSMENIRYDIDNQVPEEYFSTWYWKSLELHELHVDNWMNYESYCMGAPDVWTEQKMQELRESNKRVEEAKQSLLNLIEETKNSNNPF